MAHSNHLVSQPAYPGSLSKRMLIGGTIGLAVIAFFIVPIIGRDHPDWGKLWMIRPLIMVPLAGATGALCYHFLDQLRYQRGWSKLGIGLLSLLIFVIGLWMGIVLGLVGTMWH